MKETFNKKPYNTLSRITHVGNKNIGDSIPVTISPDISSSSSDITLEKIVNLLPTKIDESTSGTIYFGFFTSQSDSDESTLIYKIVEDSGVTSYYIPSDGLAFNKAWNDRASLDYKLKTV